MRKLNLGESQVQAPLLPSVPSFRAADPVPGLPDDIQRDSELRQGSESKWFTWGVGVTRAPAGSGEVGKAALLGHREQEALWATLRP